MAIKPAGFLLATVVQGSNDAFAQTQIQTGLSIVGNLGYEIRAIHWTHSKLLAIDNQEMQLSLSRRTKAAVASWTDPDTIMIVQNNTELATSGAFYSSNVGSFIPAGPTYIVEDSLFFQIDSANTSASNTAEIRIEYDVIRVTDAERNSLLARTILSTAQS